MSHFKTPAKASIGRARGSFSTSMNSAKTISSSSRAFNTNTTFNTNTAKKTKDTSLEEATITVSAVFNPIVADNNTDNKKKLVSLCDSKGIEVYEDKSNEAIFKGNRYVINIVYSYLICI